MNRKIGYICAAIVFVALIAGIIAYRTQGEEGDGQLGKEIVYFGNENKDDGEESARTESKETAAPEPSSSDAASGEKTPEETTSAQDEQKEADASAEPEKKEDYPAVTNKGKMTVYDSTGTVVVGDTGFEIYNYVERNASQYAKAVNRFTKSVDSGVNTYVMIVPTSIGINFPDNLAGRVNSTPQKESIQKIKKKLSGRENFLSLYEVMMPHRDEYIYFRTDHHWTQLGAYYAYAAFCQQKEMEANPITAYEKKVVEGFLGSYYPDSNKNDNLRKDDVELYFPISQNIKMTYVNENGQTVNGSVVADPTNYGISSKYVAFLSGDNSFTEITNQSKRDGSSCIVVKESFGNAFVPFLVDHYEKVYVIDYRYWSGKLVDFVKKKRVKEVILINNISMTRNAYLIGMLSKIL